LAGGVKKIGEGAGIFAQCANAVRGWEREDGEENPCRAFQSGLLSRRSSADEIGGYEEKTRRNRVTAVPP